MITVLSCITTEHDLRLVLLAAVICLLGAGTFVQLMNRAMLTNGLTRGAWVGVASVAVSTTVWCAHFISMLAYKSQAPVVLDPAITMVSLMVPVIGFLFANILFMLPQRHLSHIAGGAVTGLSISSMHYLGMVAYRIDGIVDWNVSYIVASVIGACILCIGASYTFAREIRTRFSPATVSLFSLAVIVLHFTGMTAMQVTPLTLTDQAMGTGEFIALSITVATAGLLIIATGGFAFFLDFDSRREGYQRLLKMTKTDMMTGLPNRTAYMETLENWLQEAEHHGQKLAVICVDLNRFKDINDTFGHKIGDDVLKAVSTRLSDRLSKSEIIARLGGDEFGAAKLYSHQAELDDFVTHLQNSFNTRMEFDTIQLHTSGSIGISVYPNDGSSTDKLRNNADLAMYRAKLSLSHAAIYYEASMDEEIRYKRELAQALAHAIENDELRLLYQPQASTRTGELTGVEALLRWTHPKHGAISPGVFIPVAEESGQIIALGEWVLRQACQDAAAWPNAQKVAVNMSALQLNQAELPQIIHQILLETGLSPQRLEIELTETAILEDRQRSLHVLRQIKALGVGVALDDFGTGYSSLEILRSFPFDKIKLDRFFMAEIETSIEAKALVRSVLALGQGLSIPVLAEGVETRMQLSILQQEGCDEIQGFLLGRPEAIETAAGRTLHMLADDETDFDTSDAPSLKRA